MPEAPHNLATWLEIFSSVCGVAGGIAAVLIWAVRSSFVSRSDLSTELGNLYVRLNAADGKLILIETELRHVPTQRDFNELSAKVGALSADIAGVTAILARIERPLNLLMDERMSEKS